MLRELKSYHRATFINCFKIAYSGGVPAATMGINDVSSVTDVGTAGDGLACAMWLGFQSTNEYQG